MSKPRITVLLKVVLGYLLLAFLLWLLLGCNTARLELGVGYDPYLEQGSNPRSVIRMRAERTKCLGTDGSCISEFNHHSSYKDGWPFNDRAESITNQWSLIYSYPLWQR